MDWIQRDRINNIETYLVMIVFRNRRRGKREMDDQEEKKSLRHSTGTS